MPSKKTIAVTLGDPSGIGPEIVLKALTRHPEIYRTCNPVVFGDMPVLAQTAAACNIHAAFNIIDGNDPFSISDPSHINVVPVSQVTEIPAIGQINAVSGQLAFDYIEAAVDLASSRRVDAIATAPVNKEAFRLAAVPYLDHTEILTKLTGSSRTMTLFMTGSLRVFFYSRHIPFRDIPGDLDTGRLVQTLRDCHRYLERIGISSPHVALAALNPHGGEQSMFGDEEIRILTPAVEQARASGLQVSGPVPADSVFFLATRGHYDAVLSLYHDQGHIAAKTYDFHKTISLTMGLPFLRTSVDHGTAMDLAGRNKANEISMAEAIRAAGHYAW